MLKRDQPLAIYVEGELTNPIAKMGMGVLRYSPNPIACVIDSTHAGQNLVALTKIDRPAPIVSTIDEAVKLGAEVLALGTAPSGGKIPAEWLGPVDAAVHAGMSVINGLHDLLGPRYPSLPAGQWVWDVRIEPPGLGVASGAAAGLRCKRVLMAGTDMAIGKMTAGLEMLREARERGMKAEFVATGQIGITIMGSGVPLDAVRVDYAAGAIEAEVLRYPEAELVIIEGQGAFCHPSSTSPLPLCRGSMPTHIVLCHRAGQTHLLKLAHIAIPPLREYIQLLEDIASACGTFPRPKTIGIALNTSHLDPDAAKAAAEAVQQETGLPCTDPIRFGVSALLYPLSLPEGEDQ